MKKGALAVVVIVILVAVGAALYFFVLSDSINAVKPEVRVEYSPGEYFTTNVKSDGTFRLLKVSIVLIVNEEGLEEMLTKENARIRDTIIFILRDLTDTEVLAPGTQTKLRADIILAINERLNIDNVVEVLFNDFVMA